MANVLELVAWLLHWRYVALAAVIILGNLGLPIPEEMVLIVAGFLIREGHFALGPTLAVGIASAVAGDNLGYWLGRLGGGPIVRRGARWAGVTPARLERIQGLVSRYGAFALVAARFVAGFRMLAGPLAGASGMRPLTFMAGNFVGALLFIPYALAVGYAIGRGLDAVEPAGSWAGAIQRWAPLGVAAALALAAAIARAFVRWRRRPDGAAGTRRDRVDSDGEVQA